MIVTFAINPSIDQSTSTANVAPDRKLHCGEPRFDPGGGGVNVCRAIHKLGGAATAVFPAGGCTGDMLRRLLEDEGVSMRPIPISGATRVTLTVLEESSSQQYLFNMSGPHLDEAEWRACLEELAGISPAPSYLVISGSTLPPGVPGDYYCHAAGLGKRRGSRVVVDADGRSLSEAVSEGVYLIKPNLRELSQLAGHDLLDEDSQIAVARSLCTSGKTEVVVISLGAGGALMVTKDEHEHFRTPTVPIRSRVGAGDTMVGAIVLSLERGWPLREAVRFGVAAGAAAVMRPGTQLGRLADVEHLYRSMKASKA